MMYGFCYKQGSLSYDRVKSLVNAIDFELPRNWDCSGEMNRKADEALRQVCRAFEELGADMIGAVLKMLKTICNDAEQDSYVDEFFRSNDFKFEVDADGCFAGVH